MMLLQAIFCDVTTNQTLTVLVVQSIFNRSCSPVEFDNQPMELKVRSKTATLKITNSINI